MVFGLVGLLFNLVTFPGLIVSRIVQSVVNERYGAPMERVAIDENVHIDGTLDDEILKSGSSLNALHDDPTGESHEADAREPMVDTRTHEERFGTETDADQNESENDSSWFEIETEKNYWLDSQTDEEVLDAVRPIDEDEEPEEDEKLHHVVDFNAVEQYPNMFKIVLIPLAVMTVIGAAILGIATFLVTEGIISDEGLVWLVPLWIGLSIPAHAFPNRHPTKALLLASTETDSLLRFVGYPIVAVSMLLNMLKFLWADAIYAIGVWLVIGWALGYF